MSRAKIESKDVATPPERSIDIGSDVETPDMSIVTDDTVESPHLKEFMDDLKFNEDILTFTIAFDSNKYAENPVPAAVNGEERRFFRGQRYQAPRKFVDSLIKTIQSVELEHYDDKNGLKQTRIKTNNTAVYPISIHDDPAGPVGIRWFEHQMANSF
ncbi:MAG: hypothetical protein H6937_02455 [Burkholderiales bacterium]|nr:hypothetical protein [Burkholderiales bacterium]